MTGLVFMTGLVVMNLQSEMNKQSERADGSRYATLKFDDLCPQAGVEGVRDIEQKVYQLLRDQAVLHAWGVCRLGEGDHPAFYEWIKQRDREGIEIWHHGNYHDRIKGESWEFRNRSEVSQRENLLFTQKRIFEKTGMVLKTFGAPYNRTDETTGKVLNEMEAIQIMYFSQQSPNFAGLILNDRVNLESQTGVVATLDEFKQSYQKMRDREIIVLQGHPAYWNGEEDMKKLQAIIDYLKSEGREFITPTNYLSVKTNPKGTS